MSEAIDRIEASRARLRIAMSPPPAPAVDPLARDNSWLHKLTQLPVIGTVLESVQAWWSHHPLRPVTQVAGEASNAVVKPLAERNPWTLMFAAAAVGAALAWSRPWRWIFRSALFAGLVPQLASRVVSTLPIESWMTMVSGALSPSPPPSSYREAAPDAPSG